METTKTCSKCGVVKLASEMRARSSLCKLCDKAYKAAWFVAHREEELAKSKARYAAKKAADPEFNKKAYWANPEKHRAAGRAYLDDPRNRARNIQRAKEWYAQNRHAVLKKAQEPNAKEKRAAQLKCWKRENAAHVRAENSRRVAELGPSYVADKLQISVNDPEFYPELLAMKRVEIQIARAITNLRKKLK